ncbi:aminoacyl-tRNA hydrolase [Prochlorococcus sp. MIT 1341]|uniref:aminoacyl-tRNA hydrolase n=1 Tax=Prochlorococcus sp. MIT 1341 TaxID=3096221 RepID=UPI002A74E36A|nr:aminoacyl-tRNA hydrolase [Prochlorococcus sp. MIT 1341]
MSLEDLRLLVGLGNPGSRYTSTRHNIGFMAIERLAKRQSVNFKTHKNINGRIADLVNRQKQLKLLLPDTYMNESGQAINACLKWFDIEVTQILVIVDDMDLPLGRLRLRASGGSGGHNGLRSTIQHLKTENFCRLRIGIGAPPGEPVLRKSKTTSHVLGNFTAEEKPLLEEILNEVVLGPDLIQRNGFAKASDHLNSYSPLHNQA